MKMTTAEIANPCTPMGQLHGNSLVR